MSECKEICSTCKYEVQKNSARCWRCLGDNYKIKIKPPTPGERITTIERLRQLFEEFPETWYENCGGKPFKIWGIDPGNSNKLTIYCPNNSFGTAYFDTMGVMGMPPDLRVAWPPNKNCDNCAHCGTSGPFYCVVCKYEPKGSVAEQPQVKTCGNCGNKEVACPTCSRYDGRPYVSDNWTPKVEKTCETCGNHFLFTTKCFPCNRNVSHGEDCILSDNWTPKPSPAPITADMIQPGMVFENNAGKLSVVWECGDEFRMLDTDTWHGAWFTESGKDSFAKSCNKYIFIPRPDLRVVIKEGE